MTIEGALPHSRSLALDVPAVQPPAVPPEAWSGAHPVSSEGGLRRPLLSRSSMSALHHRTLQNAAVARTHPSLPGATSLDSQLASALEKAFGLLHPFLNDARLTWSSLARIATQDAGQDEALERAVLVVREILQRPRLSDAIFSRDGDITRDSLRAAAQVLQGNSSPSLFSQDPFHAQGNAQVVQALQGQFEQLRDKTKDLKHLFEHYQYVAIATLKAVMLDPYEVDPQGAPVLDPSTGMSRPKYSELCVYTAKNILERPGLLSSLERAKGTPLLVPSHKEGWLCDKNLDRWLEQDKAHKKR